MPDGEITKEFNERLEKCIKGAPAFIKDVFFPVALNQGNSLPVSKFTRNGDMMTGTTRYYKRGIAV